jgi:hypothetical protein
MYFIRDQIATVHPGSSRPSILDQSQIYALDAA